MDKWKVMLPSCLEQKVLEYAHASLGHLGVDKCNESNWTVPTHEKPW